MNYNFENINEDPLEFIKNNKKKDIINVLIAADQAFFNSGKTILTDDIYDIIKDYIRKKYPKDPYLKRIGADIDNKVTLPYYMGSQNKIKDSDEEITKYKKKYKGPYMISDKLDGVSCLAVYKRISSENKYDIKLYTRGNGTEGQDISHLLEYINGFPNVNNIKSKYLAIRGELIISKNNWETLKLKGEQGVNPRNSVSGAINSKTLNKNLLNSIDFICYTIIDFDTDTSTNAKQNNFDMLKSKGFLIVNYEIVNDINLNILSENLQKARNNNYIIDGIVVSDISKKYNIEIGKNPSHSFAFKSIHTLEQVEVIVNEVEWNVSKDKYMKPIVKFDEILLDDVKIKQTTGFNAGYIEKNVIGPGSRVIIIRSGNVIPHIKEVLTKSASGKPSMPPGKVNIDYRWNDTHIDIIMIDNGDKNSDYDIKNIIYFMKTIGIEYMGPGNITKIYEAGFDSINKIVNIKKEDLLGIDGIKSKSADNIIEALKKIKDVDCNVLMDASNIMGRGFGFKKIKSITDVYPEIIDNTMKGRTKALKLTADDLIKINGIAKISAELFIENLPHYYEFYDNLGIIGIKCHNDKNKAVVNGNKVNNNLKDKTFIFSGFRNKDFEKIIQDNGGKVTTSISKNTNYLVVKDKYENTAKIIKANELGVTILDIEGFKDLL